MLIVFEERFEGCNVSHQINFRCNTPQECNLYGSTIKERSRKSLNLKVHHTKGKILQCDTSHKENFPSDKDFQRPTKTKREKKKKFRSTKFIARKDFWCDAMCRTKIVLMQYITKEEVSNVQ
jgi:hypothetical protein